MPQHRIDPASPDAPRVSACVTLAAERRIIELARERGVSRSAAARELIELGIERLDGELASAGRSPPDDGG